MPTSSLSPPSDETGTAAGGGGIVRILPPHSFTVGQGLGPAATVVRIAITELVGYFLPAIIGIILLAISKRKKKDNTSL